MSIKAGDVVTMPGRPKMTVEHVIDSGRCVKCVWFEGAHLYEGEFFASSVRKVS